MAQMTVHTLVVDSAGQPVLVLRPMAEGSGPTVLLPIWIGPAEAAAILVALEASPVPARPMSYDLMARLLEASRASVVRVEVSRIEQGTFFAVLTLDTPDGLREIDARPSDSIALAVRVGAPIFVADDVLEVAGVRPEEVGDGDQESEMAAFHEFLEGVDPDDFRG